jgi:hypothetical protein
MNYYCTLFDKNYLSRGLAMFSSLERVSKQPFVIYCFAMDAETVEALETFGLPSVKVVPTDAFETEDLIAVKGTRSKGEYCWTCTPAVIRHCLRVLELPECTYLDADLFFFHDPEILLDEVRAAGGSVLITPHNYTKHFDQSKTSGVYCVQFMFFRNDSGGIRVLEDWYQKCLEWCFNRFEEGKFGDQKYVDSWPQDFGSVVHVLRHLGAVAPWNVQRFDVRQDGGNPWIQSKDRRFEVVFFHFHSLVLMAGEMLRASNYPLSREVKIFIYKPYLKELLHWNRSVDGFLNSQEVCFLKGLFYSWTLAELRLRVRLFFQELFYFRYKDTESRGD